MPGTLAQDNAVQTNLVDPGATPGTAAVSVATSTTGTGMEVDRPGDVRFELVLSSVTGTSPTFDVEIQGSETSTFGSTISYGRFARKTTNGTWWLQARVYSKYVRAVATTGGTVTTASGVVTVQERNYERIEAPASSSPDSA